MAIAKITETIHRSHSSPTVGTAFAFVPNFMREGCHENNGAGTEAGGRRQR
jgi:hypothetical protein